MPLSMLSSEAQNWLTHWPDGIILLDEFKHICGVSPRALDILSWREAELLNHSMHDILCIKARQFEHEANLCPICLEAQKGVINSGYWLSGQGEYLSVDYRTVELPDSAGSRYVVNFYRNDSLPHSYAELEKFAEYVDKNPAAIAEFDCDGQMLFCNPSMQQLMVEHGFDDRGIARIFPENIADICATPTNLTEAAAPVEVELENCWLNWYFCNIDCHSGKTVIGYLFDVTAQKVAQLQASLARAEARRDFYAKMIHELRTPLNAIVGYSDLLLCRSADGLGERDQRALRGIKVGGMQLNELISDTLDISKIEAGKMTAEIETFFVSAVVDDINEQMQYLADVKKLSYEVLCPKDLQVTSDRRKVRQILINLISNAIKYTKQGSVHTEISGPLQQELRGEQTSLFSISVQDTGVGIPEDQLEELFVEYRQVREQQNRGIQGTGLGLSLVQELIEILNGDIRVQSSYGEGSCFTVRLPVSLEHF
ncbi:phospho-acceptor domain-containing protein [Alteromonadaceae bacterium 2753L.S.0a.02]|nr:phospho-acceptor domain-containing protein [Alteromonadaceae bacterium 2753L.S.0a.02]